MSGGWLGGVAAGLLAVAACGSVSGAIVINGRPLSVEPSPRVEGDVVLVPISSVAPLLGIEAQQRDGRWVLRWRGGCDALPADAVQEVRGTACSSLLDLVTRVGGEVRGVGGDLAVTVPTANLIDLRASAGELLLRFDSFAPMSLVRDGHHDVVRFDDCRTALADTSIRFGPSDVGSATLTTSGDACVVDVAFLEEAALSVRRVESDGAYTVTLAASDEESSASTLRARSGVECFEATTTIDGRGLELAYVWIEGWRERADVRPLLPPTGTGTEALLGAAMATAGASVGLSSRSRGDVGLVVVDGTPFALGDGDSPTLGIDAFGSLQAVSPGAAAFAASPAGRIPLDGVDRPVGDDELIGYPPGYTGSISRGFPEGFRVVRLRDGVVVSILDASFVVADPSAALLVAAGAARARLANLALGDAVAFETELRPAGSFLVHAVSIDGWLVWGGRPATELTLAAPTWSVAGTDWQGGFFFARLESDDDLSAADVLSALAVLPAPPRDAAALETGGAAALELDLGEVHAWWGASGAVLVGLGAILK